MALFEGFKRKPGTRSNTQLVISHGDSPAEKWIQDPTLPVLFDYEYGGPGQKNVVISKGMIVALSGTTVKDFETGKHVPVLTIANGSNKPVGMVPYNISKYDPLYFGGNQPAIITREYVELPYIPDATKAANIKWGAVYGAGIVAGDHLKPGTGANAGQLTKWVDGDPVSQLSAQVLAVETDQEPLGWLKWAMWDETAKREDDSFINRNNAGVPGDNGFPYDPNYKTGTQDMDGYLSDFTTNPTGIPGLTDGANRNLYVYTFTRTIANGESGTTILFGLGKTNLIEVTTATLAAADVKADLVVNKKDGVVSYAVPAGSDTKTLTVNFRINHPGTLPGWDFDGAVGAVRLLLKF